MSRLIIALPTVQDRVSNSDFHMTLEEIGQEMHLTRERVRQIQNAALEKLRRNYPATLQLMRDMAIELRRSSDRDCHGVIQ